MTKGWSETVQKTSRTGAAEGLEGLLRGVTLEVALYGLLFLLAAGLRLWGLGDRPLQEVEASQALSAWRFYRGEAQGVLPGYRPPLLYGQLLSFVAWGINDFAVRIWPALAGGLVAISPALLRRQLGRWGALGASALATFSPSMIFFSRFGSGDMLSLLGAVGLVVGILRFGRSGEARDLRIAVLGLALALCAGPGGYTTLLAVVLWGLMLALGRSRWPAVGSWWEELSRIWLARRRLWVQAIGLFGVAFLLLSTGLLLNFDGLHGGIAQFSRWRRAQVELPEPKPSAAKYIYRSDVLTISVICDQQGKLLSYQVEGQMISPEQVDILNQKLWDRKRTNPQVQVNLRADRRADGKVVEALMAACAQAGISHVNLVAALD